MERTLLEKVHSISSIGTFVLTIVVVALMVYPMLTPAQPHQQSAVRPTSGWVMPSVLACSLLIAGILHFLAARATPLESKVTHQGDTALASPPAVDSKGRIFLGKDVSPKFLQDLQEGHTSMHAAKVVEPYIGKWMRIHGNVANVGELEYGWSTVTLIREREDPSVFLHFDEKWEPHLSVLRRNSSIDVIGKIRDINAFGITLDQCEIV